MCFFTVQKYDSWVRKQSKELLFYIFILSKNAVAMFFVCPADPASDLEALYFLGG